MPLSYYLKGTSGPCQKNSGSSAGSILCFAKGQDFEQCHILENAPEPVTLKDPKEIPADSLQSPADPDATYGRQGKGYKASLTETCAPENPFQVITDVAVDAAGDSR